jgi:hypothetical protein
MAGQSSTSSSSRVSPDPERVALSFGGTRGTVYVLTKEGAEYVFPDMSVDELKKVLPESGRVLESMPILMMMNASMAVLNLPFRIVKQVRAGEEVLWDCPA